MPFVKMGREMVSLAIVLVITLVTGTSSNSEVKILTDKTFEHDTQARASLLILHAKDVRACVHAPVSASCEAVLRVCKRE